MAFYISRLDENGNETERLTPPSLSLSAKFSGSSTSWKTCRSKSSQSKIDSCAVYIERIGEHHIEPRYESSSDSSGLNCGKRIECSSLKCGNNGSNSLNTEVGDYHSLNAEFSKTINIICEIGECSSLNCGESIEEHKEVDFEYKNNEKSSLCNSLGYTGNQSSALIEADILSGEIESIALEKNQFSIMLECVDDDKCVKNYCNAAALFKIPTVFYIPSKRNSAISLQLHGDGHKIEGPQKLKEKICTLTESEVISKENHKIQETKNPKDQLERKENEKRRQSLAKDIYQKWLETKACQQLPSGRKSQKLEKRKSQKQRQEEETWQHFKKWLDKECYRIKQLQNDVN